jgi:hypothetical protein
MEWARFLKQWRRSEMWSGRAAGKENWKVWLGRLAGESS